MCMCICIKMRVHRELLVGNASGKGAYSCPHCPPALRAKLAAAGAVLVPFAVAADAVAGAGAATTVGVGVGVSREGARGLLFGRVGPVSVRDLDEFVIICAHVHVHVHE